MVSFSSQVLLLFWSLMHEHWFSWPIRGQAWLHIISLSIMHAGNNLSQS